MPPAVTPPASASTPPALSAPASPAASPPASVDDTALKSTKAGVKKPGQKKGKKARASQALREMHAFFKAHRDDDECKDMTFLEKQRVLGKLWKASPENPKNSAV